MTNTTSIQRVTILPVEMMTAEQWEHTYQTVTPRVDAYRTHRTEWHRLLMLIAMMNAGVTEWDGMSYTGEETD